MTKEEFVEKWGTNVFEKIGLTEALSQQLDAEFKKDLDAVIEKSRQDTLMAASIR